MVNLTPNPSPKGEGLSEDYFMPCCIVFHCTSLAVTNFQIPSLSNCAHQYNHKNQINQWSTSPPPPSPKGEWLCEDYVMPCCIGFHCISLAVTHFKFSNPLIFKFLLTSVSSEKSDKSVVHFQITHIPPITIIYPNLRPQSVQSEKSNKSVVQIVLVFIKILYIPLPSASSNSSSLP